MFFNKNTIKSQPHLEIAKKKTLYYNGFFQ